MNQQLTAWGWLGLLAACLRADAPRRLFLSLPRSFLGRFVCSVDSPVPVFISPSEHSGHSIGGSCDGALPPSGRTDVHRVLLAGIAGWRLCVCVKRTRFTVQTRRELWPPSTRRRGGSARTRSSQAFERWSTERPRAKRRNNSPFELCAVDSTAQQLICSSRGLKNTCKCCSAFHPAGPSLRSGLPLSRHYFCQIFLDCLFIACQESL